MSKLVVDTIEDRSASEEVDATYVVHGTNKLWVRYNQTTPAVNDSLNVSSVDDDATGDFSVNLTTSMSDANYGITGMSGRGATNSNTSTQATSGETPAAGTFGVVATNSAGTNVDHEVNSCAVHGVTA